MLMETPVAFAYLSAAELEITEEELKALKLVREGLASGEIAEDLFDMSETGGCGCGSVACIGGHMGLMMGLKWQDLSHYVVDESSPSLSSLFYPWDLQSTPAQAVRAIDAWASGRQEDCWLVARPDSSVLM